MGNFYFVVWSIDFFLFVIDSEAFILNLHEFYLVYISL